LLFIRFVFAVVGGWASGSNTIRLYTLNIGAVFPVSGGSSGNIQNSDRSSGLR
jgi:hypothetical protein